MGLSRPDDDLAADEAQQAQRVGQRATEPSPFQGRQVRLPDSHGLGGIRLSDPGCDPEVLERRAQIPCRDHQVLVVAYCHKPIIADYWLTVISSKSNNEMIQGLSVVMLSCTFNRRVDM